MVKAAWWRNFLEKHGEGIHHISVHTDDLKGDKASFEEAGVRIFWEVPRILLCLLIRNLSSAPSLRFPAEEMKRWSFDEV